MEIKSAALIGVGAVGSYFAYGLPAKLGRPFLCNCFWKAERTSGAGRYLY